LQERNVDIPDAQKLQQLKTLNSQSDQKHPEHMG
jgi:hypothetical protein